MLFVLLIVFVSGVSLLRSIELSIPALVLSGLIVAFSYQAEELIRRGVTSRAWRGKMEEMLLNDLSQAIHTEKKFAFLADLARIENELMNLNPEEINKDFENMDRLVSLMRICSAADPAWRAVRAGVNNIRRICSKMLLKNPRRANSKVNFPGSVESTSFRHALDRLNSELVDYRKKMRLKRSVSFVRAWKEIEREYTPMIEASDIDLELDLPDDIEKYRVHLLHDEFRHIFKNLLDNSIWAVKESVEKKISLNCYFEANYLVVRWRDTGAGMPESLRKVLFSSPVESSRPGGTGEGCYISREILRRRSGLIRDERTYTGVGTGFIVKMIKLN
jgi:signal transduction histidine kinase